MHDALSCIILVVLAIIIKEGTWLLKLFFFNNLSIKDRVSIKKLN